jgi:phospholipase/carboxylesterase
MFTRLGSLDVEVVAPLTGSPKGAVVLCHGFGAPGDDLVPLARALQRLEPRLAQVSFYFPSAPLSLEAFGGGTARAWWLIDFEALARLNRGDPGALRAFRQQAPEGLAEARAALQGLLSQVLVETGLSPGALVVGGFSQGAMLSTDVTLQGSATPAGLAVLSGTLLTEDPWRAGLARHPGLAVFQAHGRQDPVLGFAAAEALRALLEGGGAQVTFTAFEGGHGIPVEVLQGLGGFLCRRLGL